MTAASVTFPTRPATPVELQATRTTKPARLKFLTVKELLAQPPLAWRVLRVIPARGLIVLWGVSGSGKSFIAIDLAAAIVRGLPWSGRRTKRGNVVYVATEGRLQHRVEAYLHHARISADALDGLHTLASGVSLLDSYDVAALVESLRALAEDVGGIDVLIIDTLNRAMPGGDENSSEDMGRAIASAKEIEEALGCAVILVHHGGKDQARGPRGHSSLKAAVDAELLVERDGDTRTVKVEKSRDGADGDILLTFRLRIVDLGPAKDADPEADDDERITSCVVESSVATAVSKPARIPKGADVALRALREMVAEYGERMPGTSAIPPGVKATTMGRWRERYYLHDPIDDSDPEQRGKELDARKKRFVRARTSLQEAAVVGLVGDIVWIN